MRGLAVNFRSLKQVTRAVCKTAAETCEVTRKLPARTRLNKGVSSCDQTWMTGAQTEKSGFSRSFRLGEVTASLQLRTRLHRVWRLAGEIDLFTKSQRSLKDFGGFWWRGAISASLNPTRQGCESARVEVDLWSKRLEKAGSLRKTFVKRSHFCALEPDYRVWGSAGSFLSLKQVTRAVCKTAAETCELTRKLRDRTRL